jgi:hypothetical protein
MEERFLRTGAVQPARERRAEPTLARVIGRGLLRFLAIVVVAVGVSVGAALLIGHWRGSDLSRAVTLGLYLGGACLIAVPLLSAGGRPLGSGGTYEYMEIPTDPSLRRAWQAQLVVYVAVGLVLIGLGVLVETLHS